MSGNSAVIWVTVLVLSLWEPGWTSLHNKFRHFHILEADRFVTRVKRDAASRRLISQTVSFSAFQRDFVMTLTPGSPVLRPDFQAHFVESDGALTPIAFDTENILTGLLHQVPGSVVSAVYVDGLWLAQINAPEAVYSVEPLRYHDSSGSASAAIMFRLSDVRNENLSDSTHNDELFRPLFSAGDFGKDTEDVKEDVSDQWTQITPGYRRPTDEKPRPNRKDRTVIPSLRTQSQYSMAQKAEVTLDEPNTPRQIHSKFPRSKLTGVKGMWNRERRQAELQHLVCDIQAVADYLSFQLLGEGSARRVLAVLVSVYQRVNLLLATEVRFGTTIYGIYLRNIRVHRNYTVSAQAHYNMEESNMTANQILQLMSGVQSFTQHCLVHLTTMRNFKSSLGTAVVAEATERWRGGICGSMASMATNVGLSTLYSWQGMALSLATYSLVVTHEIAHGWGSPHDPQNDLTCSPPSAKGGKYIMWPVPGLSVDANSDKFSPCSLQAMYKVLRIKAHKCFLNAEDLVSRCGDGVVDPGEECDSGLDESGEDNCCTQTCRFQVNATCSPLNHRCCTSDCTVAPVSQMCQAESDIPCYGVAYCSGRETSTCPPAPSLPNHSPCGDGGICWYGRCVSYCAVLGLSLNPPRQFETCTCDNNPIFLCYHCCRDVGTHNCIITSRPFQDGTPCLLGRCFGGICIRSVGKVGGSSADTQISWDFLTLVWNRLWTALTVAGFLWVALATYASSRKKPTAAPRPGVDHTTTAKNVIVLPSHAPGDTRPARFGPKY